MFLEHTKKESGFAGYYLVKEIKSYVEDYIEDVQKFKDHDLVTLEGNTLVVIDLFTDSQDARRYSLVHGYSMDTQFIDTRR